jgi:ABC-type nitrate/sulfonate/bicarbonate transport system substrate-binding protein
MTYEPYLSAVRAKPEAGKIIATTLDYPMVMDTFGCTPKFLSENPKAAKALADSYFEAVEMIQKDPKKSFEIMGADVKQTGEQFEASVQVPALAGPRGQPEVLRRRARRLQQGSRRPAAGSRHHQADARHGEAGRHALPEVPVNACGPCNP